MKKKLNFWIITELTDVNGSFVLRRLGCSRPLATSSFRLQACGLRTFYCVGKKKGYLQVYRSFQFYLHTSGVSKNNIKLNPLFVTGFIDGEGCFGVNVQRSPLYRTGFQIQLFFCINLHEKDKPLLEQIKNLFSVGSIYKHGSKSSRFIVQSIKDMRVIIDHFDQYPLITDKWADYQLLKQIFNKILSKEHLTLEGLGKIVSIKASMNLGLSYDLKVVFPNIVPAPCGRPLVENKKIQDPHWLAGFTSAEGCFFVSLTKSKTHSLGIQVKLEFKLTQHSRDENLMKSLINFFECGGIYKKRETFNFQVTKFDDITQKIIPFFQKYSIRGVKAEDFKDFIR